MSFHPHVPVFTSLWIHNVYYPEQQKTVFAKKYYIITWPIKASVNWVSIGSGKEFSSVRFQAVALIDADKLSTSLGRWKQTSLKFFTKCNFFQTNCLWISCKPVGVTWKMLISHNYYDCVSALPRNYCYSVWVFYDADHRVHVINFYPWWRHQMETFYALLAICAGNRWIPLTRGQWREALMFSLICAWTNGWVNNRDAGDLKRHCTNYDVTVMVRYCYNVFERWIFHDISCKTTVREKKQN